jgi:hypothetical protein
MQVICPAPKWTVGMWWENIVPSSWIFEYRDQSGGSAGFHLLSFINLEGQFVSPCTTGQVLASALTTHVVKPSLYLNREREKGGWHVYATANGIMENVYAFPFSLYEYPTISRESHRLPAPWITCISNGAVVGDSLNRSHAAYWTKYKFLR